MKRSSLLIKLALLVCVAIAIVSAPPSSLAYLTADSNIVHNNFNVEYQPPQDISVPIMIQKSMVNQTEEEIGPEGFIFHLVNEETGEITVATSSADGLATMDLPFTAEDVGKTYHYRLYEVNTGLENVTYDETVYEITVTIYLNLMHEMSVELIVDGNPVTEIFAEFTNQYYLPIPLPDTGDHAHPMLWMAMLVLSGAGLMILRKKSIIFRRQ